MDFADLTSIKRETESNVQASLKNCLIEKPNNDAAELEWMNTDIFDTIESSNEIEIIGTSYSNSVTLVPSDSNSDHQSGPNFFRNLSGDSDISSLNNENNKVQVYNATQNEENLQINIEESTSELCSFPSVFPNDPALLPTTISYELKNHFFSLGPCQPSALELKNKIFPQKKDSQDGKFVKRLWLSYSPSQDRFYCITCKLFGFPKAKKIFLADKGSNDYKNIKRTIENHESFPEHLTSEMARGMYEKNLRIDSGMHERANRKVAENRQIVSVIIDALIFTARQNIALRGHNEKYTSTNRGNFLELCSFLSTYHPILKLHLEKLKENKINRLSFLSNVTQNKLLCILADMVRTNILKQVNKSGQFAVIIDTTTDVSNQEQFTVILRYIDEGKPQERLVALETAADSTGLGMFKMFCSITEKHNIKWKTQMIAQTYDGAASMQGKYSGLKTRIQAENPRAMFTWCFAHKLNLVIVDTCDCCINTKNFFGDVGALIEFMRARKRTAAFVECQEILNPKEQKRRIKRFSNTRWTSHDRALVVIQEKYPALLKALENISKANDSDRDTTSMAKNLISVITSFQFVLVLVLMTKIFSISTEVSNYLQSKSIDFMQAIKMVNVAKNRLKMVRTDDGCTEIINSAKEFATKNNLLQYEVLCSPADLFRCDVCFKVLDVIITSINLRFNDSQEILKDLSLLTSERMLSIKTKKQLPDNAFQQLSNWININTTKLQCEYLAFSNSLNDLFNDTNPTYTSKPVNKESEGTDQPPDISSEISDESEIEEASTTNMSCLDILGLLSRHNLIAAFPNLYLAYKALCIIPASSASAERSFSKLYFLEGMFSEADKVKLSNNGYSYLFEQIRLEINGIEVDSTRVLGITSSLKGYLSGTPDNYNCYENSGWNFKNATQSANDKAKVTLNKIIWKVPHITVDDEERLKLLKLVEKEKSLFIPFRSFETFEYPELGTVKKVVWNLKTASKLEKPRFIIIGLQKGRKNTFTKDCSIFDHCNLKNVGVFLNSIAYPYDNLNLDFIKNNFTLLYHMYTSFQESYYEKSIRNPILSPSTFLSNAPIIVIDTSKEMIQPQPQQWMYN
ncbi:hypothetical protein QTP88_001954 [Uroleucon formosanum]